MQKLAYNFTLEEAYAFMGLPYGASPEEVKNKYRILAPTLHPDLGGDEEEMKKLNRAKKVIDANIGSKLTRSNAEQQFTFASFRSYIKDAGLRHLSKRSRSNYWGVGEVYGRRVGTFITDTIINFLHPKSIVSLVRIKSEYADEDVIESVRIENLTKDRLDRWLRIVKSESA